MRRPVVAAFLSAALAYASVEIWFAEGARWAMAPRAFTPTTRLFTAVLLLSYLLVAVVCAVIDRIGRRSTEEQAKRVAAIVVTALFTLNLLFNLHLAVVPLLVAALLLIVAQTSGRFGLFDSPWVVAFVLIAPDSVANTYLFKDGLAVRSAAFAISVIGAVGLCALGSRLFANRRYPVVEAGVIVASVMAAFTLRVPPRPDLNQTTTASVLNAPNILLITLDTVRAGHLSLYGYPRRTTPNLDRFANSAAIYRHAIATSNMTLSTHGSLFTGLLASQHGAHFYADNFPGRLRGNVPTIGEVFRRRGYDVSSIAANPLYLGTAFGLDRGFTHLENAMPPRPDASLNTVYVRNSQWLRYAVWRFWRRYVGALAMGPPCTRADEITRRALLRVDHAAQSRRPFFLFLNYFDAHEPYRPPEPWISMFQRPGDSTRERTIAAYDGGIAFIDAQLGLLLRGLADRGLLDKTLIVITADHGEAFGEHRTEGHGTSNYGEQEWVPLIVREPGVKPGTVAKPVSLVDVFSFLVDRRPIGESPVVSEAFPLDPIVHNATTEHAGRAFVDGDFKLIRNAIRPDELYDLRADPGETRNLATAQPAMYAHLSVQLGLWVAAHPAAGDAGRRPRLSDEAIQRLRALGYMQ